MSFKLLLKNPIVDSYTYLPLQSQSIVDHIGMEVKLPNKMELPFLFSCFALSIDGKLCYPDKPSGFNIASSNHHASIAEKKADLWSLMLARSISDALIIGSNSLSMEHGEYTPEISIAKLNKARQDKKLPKHVWTIVMAHSLDNLDFKQVLFSNSDFPVMVCCYNGTPSSKIPDSYSLYKLSELKSREQLQQKNIVIIDTDYLMMYKTFKQLGFNVILNESPYTHHRLLEQQLLDEVWLNYSASYIGGSITSLGDKQSSFNSKAHPDTEILTLHHIDYHFLYSRQRILYNYCLLSTDL